MDELQAGIKLARRNINNLIYADDITLMEESKKELKNFLMRGLPWWLRWSAYNVGDPSSIPGSGRSPGEGNGNPLQYSCLENPMDGGAW